MLYQLEKLNDSEKESVLSAPAYITILIAGADNDIQEVEIKRSLQLVHIKSFSESLEISEVYKEIDHDFETQLHEMIDALPRTLEARQKLVVAELEKLNAIFGKLDATFAQKYYASLLSFARFIATAAGGVFGFERISPREQQFVGLPMLTEPK
ncbi:MAG: hypothetical protein EP332_08915 [Bacteroidetes bacterium]|nr:MAG: hypothetical protein EP332_08915 [Bacteroidota bacterium]